MDDKLSFFKEQYEQQLQLRESLTNRFTIIISIVTLLFGGIFYCIMNINDLENFRYSFWILIEAAIVSVVLDAIIVVLLLLHFRGADYSYMPSPKALDDVYKQLERAKQAQPSLDVETEFKKRLYQAYIEASEHNWNVNDGRRKRLGRIHVLIVCSFITTLIAIACYVPSFFYDSANTQKVEVTNTPNIQFKEVPNVKQSGQ
jgi:hypothetical protein